MHLPIESKDEAEALLGMLDIATKSGGLQVAQVAVHFAGKVQAMLQAAAQPADEPAPAPAPAKPTKGAKA